VCNWFSYEFYIEIVFFFNVLSSNIFATLKVNYYESLCGCRFSKGWIKFMKECKVEIGDTCLLKLIDERKFVFDVSIAGKNPLAVCSPRIHL
jgi:hypothetical protein